MTRRLLLVEDDTNVAGTLSSRLRREGFARDACRQRARGARGHRRQQRFHVAVLDVGLPDGNGFEVARHLREAQPAAPRCCSSPPTARRKIASTDWNWAPTIT